MANNSTKTIKFNFDDGGSLRRVKQMYEDFTKELLEKSSSYASGFTNFNSNQIRYLKESIQQEKNDFEERKRMFEERKKMLEELEKREEAYKRSLSAGNINQSYFDSKIDEIAEERRDTLRGTGYRKAHTFLKGEGDMIESEGAVVNRLEKLIETSNVLLREILTNADEEANKIIDAIQSDENATPEEMLAAAQAQHVLSGRGRGRRGQNDGGGDDKSDVFWDILRSGTFLNILKGVRGVFGNNSATDASQRASELAVETGIGVADMIAKGVGSFGSRWLGQNGAKIAENLISGGARILGVGANVATDQIYGAYRTRQEFEQSLFQNRALTGSLNLPFSSYEMGYSGIESSNMMSSLLRGQGSSSGAATLTKIAQILERGYGIDVNMSTSLLELVRTNKESDKNLAHIVGGIYTQGREIFSGDRTFLGEFITKNFSTLQRELLRNQTSVRSGTVMDILTQFNSIGGQFSARHQNSNQLISSINDALRNPQNDTMEALTFAALRRENPNASLLDIFREREKGLSSPAYFRSVMNQLEMMGGGEDFQVMQLANAFGINYNAATDLYRNRGKLRNFSDTELRGQLSALEATQNTTTTQRQNAEMTDAQLSGNFDKMRVLLEEMVNVWKEATSGATYTLNESTRQVTIKNGVVGNVSKLPPVKNNLTLGQQATKQVYGAYPSIR